jgi:hypothetical protein
VCSVKWGSPELQAQYGHLSPEELHKVGQAMLEEDRATGRTSGPAAPSAAAHTAGAANTAAPAAADTAAAAPEGAAVAAPAPRVRRMRRKARPEAEPEGELIGNMKVQPEAAAAAAP